MTLEDNIKCIRSSLNAPKVILKRAPNKLGVNLFNGKILLAWKANLDIQIVLEPYGCASYVVGYISKSQRGMSALLEAAAKEARKDNSDIKKQVRHIQGFAWLIMSQKLMLFIQKEINCLKQ